MSLLGIGLDEDRFLTSTPLPGGAETKPFLDPQRHVVYKLFDLKAAGGLGKKLVLEIELDPQQCRAVPIDATLYDTLEELCILHEAGTCPPRSSASPNRETTSFVKQPLCYAYADFEEDRRTAAAIHAVMPKSSLGPEVRVFRLEGKAWCLGDLHKGNIMREVGGAPTIIDALIGPRLPDSCATALSSKPPSTAPTTSAKAAHHLRTISSTTSLTTSCKASPPSSSTEEIDPCYNRASPR